MHEVKNARLILVLASLLITVLVAVAALMAAKGHRVSELEALEMRRVQGISALRTAYEAMLDMEGGQRAYLLTGDETYLAPFKEANSRFSASIDSVRELAADNAELSAILDVVANFQRAKSRELTYAVSLYEAGQKKEAQDIVLSPEDRHVMEAARQQYQIGISLLDKQGEQIHHEIRARITEAERLFVAMSVLILCLVAAGGLLAQRAHAKLEVLSQQFHKESIHDALTGLPNRRYLDDWFSRMRDSAVRSNGSLSLLFMDLDGFKRINDDYGHAVGDEVLKSVAHQFRKVIRGSDFLARIGGDEFVVLVHENVTAAQLRVLSKRLLETAKSQLIEQVPAGALGVSIGAAHWPQDGDDLRGLLATADDLMYRAKQGGKGDIVFSPTLASALAA